MRGIRKTIGTSSILYIIDRTRIRGNNLARPKSDDKRNAIISAATQIFAERGLGAPTSAISALAGIAEGTLFTYFKTKDDLVNALYREIKQDLADAMMSGFPRKKSVRSRLQHVWNCYTTWGISHPQQRKVLTQLQLSSILTTQSREAGSAPFAEIETLGEDAIEQGILQNIPMAFVAATLDNSAQTTMNFMASNPRESDWYRDLGFDMFWKSVKR
ncbi:TetR/AcrR family transcriptional regulator [Granulicella sp. L60]|jgi:AcrR family transcriptional regulator|uniref:TetR/AcrR family transcriptional regulator n=1 Tax=Granulicella sp. L60 TaxID=1641866 RepID=UPI00131C3317|nr:TetR/AcrR family transcriptional regulator [Granulicella sp. L60]